MADVELYYGTGACSRVTMVALEEIGLDYHAIPLNFSDKGAYLSINPNGEVPALRIGDRIYTQNAAILFGLAKRYPQAKLLPEADDLGFDPGLGDLIWCSSSLHIMRRQVLNPVRFTNGDLDSVRSKGAENWQSVLARIAERLSHGAWWYGDEWSIVDVYVNWAYTGATEQGTALIADWLKPDRWPALAEHDARLRSRPSFVRALERERFGYQMDGPK